MTYASVKTEVDGHIAVISLLGPGKGNTMGPEFWDEFPLAIQSLNADENVRAIVLRGTGDNFTYGLDLQTNAATFMPLMQGGNLGKQRIELMEMILRWQEVANCLEACTTPVIAAIHGWCIGGGIDLISAADWRLCSAEAKFSLREVRIAITADLGALQRLPDIIGQGATRRIAMTGEDFDADFALSMGLVEAVYESPEALFEAAMEQASQVAANSPLVVRGVKEVLNDCRDKSLADGLKHVALWNSAFLESNDLKETFTALMERRAPEYSGD